MAFIVKKKIHGKDYFYLNENKRIDGKVKTRSVAYLGKNKKEAVKKAKEIISGMEKNKGEKIQSVKEERVTEIEERKVDFGNKIDEIVKIATTKGFFFQTAGIYGSSAGFYTYGHLGKLLKNNWESLWRKNILGLNENFYEIQSNNILPEKVFIASGHAENFNDPMVECKKCNSRFRADQFLEEQGVNDAEKLNVVEMNKIIAERKLKCPNCGGEISEARQFNMMFSVNVGFNDEKSYLSPETAQGAYVSFLDEFKATRERLPLGLAIIDKAYRNEISPRQMFFRLREFTQAELQIFFDPEKVNEHEKWEEVKDYKLRVKFSDSDGIFEISCEEANKKKGIPRFYLYHAAKVQQFYLNVLKTPKERFRFRELSEKERAFYNKIHFDVEIDLDTLRGFKEVAGVHYRGEHDLAGHQKVSGKKLEVFSDGKKVLPHVLELSFGVDRNVWALLDLFYSVGKEGSMFKFPGIISPIKAAVFPIVKRDDLEEIAGSVTGELKKEWSISYDRSGSIGRRYARNDEIGTPYCITVDDESAKNKDVTIRNRDTGEQIRVKLDKLKEVIRALINSEIEFRRAGKVVDTRKKQD